MQHADLHTKDWKDYELLDSGESRKIERFGEIILVRPEPQAIWEKKNPELWAGTHANFSFKDGKGAWSNKSAPHEWTILWEKMKLNLHLTNFKHIGVFPEQQPNWEWLASKNLTSKKILNLFGYTGAASIVCALQGAQVTHVDASRQSLDWAKENMLASNLSEDTIRWILDDALTFIKREAKRGNVYDGIILDPPAFGRGAKGEVWHIEEDLPVLMKELVHLLATDGFLLLNGYAAGYTSLSFAQLVQTHFPKKTIAFGELQLKSSKHITLSQGIYARF